MDRPVRYPNLVLFVVPHFDPGSYYSLFKVTVLAKAEGFDDFLIGRVYESEPGGNFADLVITGDTDRRRLVAFDNPITSLEVEWRSDSLRREDLERGLAVINDLEEGLTKFEKDCGPPASFGYYIARVAKALGIGLIQVQESDGRPECNLGLEEGRLRVDAIIIDWQRQAREDRDRMEAKNSDP